MRNNFKSGFVMLLVLCVALLLMATAAYAQRATQGGGGPGGPGNGEFVPAGQLPPSCYDDIKNQDEVNIDCGGVCANGKPEECDGLDNNKNCLVDEGEVCKVTPAAEVFEKPKAQQPIPVPERMPDGPIPDYIVYNGPDEAADNSATAHSSGVEAAIPATPAPEQAEVANAEGKQSKGEAAKPVITGQSPQPSKPMNDENNAENLPKPVVKPQAPSFFSKVKGFFKKFFG